MVDRPLVRELRAVPQYAAHARLMHEAADEIDALYDIAAADTDTVSPLWMVAMFVITVLGVWKLAEIMIWFWLYFAAS